MSCHVRCPHRLQRRMMNACILVELIATEGGLNDILAQESRHEFLFTQQRTDAHSKKGGASVPRVKSPCVLSRPHLLRTVSRHCCVLCAGNVCKFLTILINIVVWNKHSGARPAQLKTAAFCSSSALLFCPDACACLRI